VTQRARDVLRVVAILGTRPEVIKLAPVVRALRQRPEFAVRVCSTGQHREMAQQALGAFGLKVDIQFDAMSAAQSLGRLTSQLFRDVDSMLESEAPDWVIVQGDTTSAMVGAVGAFYRCIRVGHVEAGLRTYDRWAPFPEEINRTFITQVADLHFAPTNRAAENLARAGVAAERIHITGNTVVDSLTQLAHSVGDGMPEGLDPEIARLIEGRRLILVTGHRREAFGEGMLNICQALREIVTRYSNAVVVYPVHLNPNVRGPVHAQLAGHERIRLLEPLSYLPLIWLMRRSYLVLTDSGGIQEEAPTFGKPVLVMREVTERPEGIEAGCARLVGTNVAGILTGVQELFDNRASYEAMTAVANPYGDGRASERIAQLMSISARVSGVAA
jgi:UDP-N-acetylglucosamine 2-epimerase